MAAGGIRKQMVGSGLQLLQRQVLLRPYPRGLAGMNDSGRGREVR